MEIKPQYLPFELAKLVHEKGFDTEHFNGTWNVDEQKMYPRYSHGLVLEAKHLIIAPEIWQVVEWLRLVHNIHIQPEKRFHKKGYFVGKIHIAESSYTNPFSKPFNSPELAYLAAIKFVLENTLNNK